MSARRNPIEKLADRLAMAFPGVELEIDPPGKPTGSWFLDASREGHSVVVEWRKDEGFGITSSEFIGFGVGADEVYPDFESAYARVASLLFTKERTTPPAAHRIQELRKERGMTQETLATLLEVRQAAVSKLERRGDVLVSTVREVVRSMGGELSITARFPDGMERTLVFDEPESKKPPRKPAKPAPTKRTGRKRS